MESKGMLLALAPGLRQTGWAVFDGATVAAGGVAAPKNPRKPDAADRYYTGLYPAAQSPADRNGGLPTVGAAGFAANPPRPPRPRRPAAPASPAGD